MRLLDLFCGAGGAAMGYSRAGFEEIVGVDCVPQPRYPFTFVLGDALEYVKAHGQEFDAIHASPPCQAYSTVSPQASRYVDLYEATRRELQRYAIPFVIENVIGAPYQHGVTLCGTMFALEHDGEWVRRHRNFETSWLIFQPEHRHRRDRRAITITGHCFLSATKDCARHSRQPTFETAKRAMRIEWMNRDELTQAIPPAYTEFIGRQLIQSVPRGSTSGYGVVPIAGVTAGGNSQSLAG